MIWMLRIIHKMIKKRDQMKHWKKNLLIIYISLLCLLIKKYILYFKQFLFEHTDWEPGTKRRRRDWENRRRRK